ncbi:hypothetical protein [Pseudomonas sp. MUP55]|uniref:hypothetical protein n=1 Tax=Pseudomonas sp. MUP55 TaxID=3087234 RepID=UPI002A5A83FB|nr:MULTISPECIES: hypothetical protein [unclassified Pseudomonas]WPN93574.1 hypothetical protein SC319_04165 [Pseudomonas sp. MUP56]WPN99100.1 hypothetical protein SC318_04165 [Pseudomonas sp. MUP55]
MSNHGWWDITLHKKNDRKNLILSTEMLAHKLLSQVRSIKIGINELDEVSEEIGALINTSLAPVASAGVVDFGLMQSILHKEMTKLLSALIELKLNMIASGLALIENVMQTATKLSKTEALSQEDDIAICKIFLIINKSLSELRQ